MGETWNPSQAKRKEMADYLENWLRYWREVPPGAFQPSPELAVDTLIERANSTPGGAPVGEVRESPNGWFLAIRVNRAGSDGWDYVALRGDPVFPSCIAGPDSWRVLHRVDSLQEAEWDSCANPECCTPSPGAPVGTIARRPDGSLAELTADGWVWRIPGGELCYGDEAAANSWPVIYDPTDPS